MLPVGGGWRVPWDEARHLGEALGQSAREAAASTAPETYSSESHMWSLPRGKDNAVFNTVHNRKLLPRTALPIRLFTLEYSGKKHSK